MSFKNITPEEYQRLINNKNRIFDLTFKTPEVLNYEILKYLNEDQDINILIGSYLAGNNSKNLSNKINKILYDKY